MSFLRMSLGAAFVAAVAACTATTSGSGTNGPNVDVASAPVCAAGTFELDGVVDSIDRTSTSPVGNYGSADVGNPSTLTVEFGLGGSLQLQWYGTIASGMAAPATGTLTLPPANGAVMQQVLCVGSGSAIQPFAWGGKFVATGLLHAPSPDACAAPATLMPATG
jgi:hypothetical protein